MLNAKLTDVQKWLAAAKAWFNRTSKGSKRFKSGIRARHFKIFMFANRHDVRDRWKVVYHRGITDKKALAEIGGAHLRKRYTSKAASLSKKKALLRKMVLREGAILKTLRTVYVRDPDARQRCIEKYGPQCFICKFSFEARYRNVADGFIHVHHLRQLSDIRKEHTIDPVKHLRPVCPNCHAVLHLRNPPYSIAKVKSFLL
jgi:predicted HNH restriction endonuclease